MRVLVPILIVLVTVGCGQKAAEPAKVDPAKVTVAEDTPTPGYDAR